MYTVDRSGRIIFRAIIRILIISVGVSACSIFRQTPRRSVDSSRLVSLSKAKRFISKLTWPVRGAKVSSLFGYRRSNFHEGIDMPAPEGTSIYAAHAGQVVYCRDGIRGYGKMVVLRTDDLLTVYGHVSEFRVRLGDNVKEGDVIAYVGHTGDATGPHLHFETRIKDSAMRNIAVDPMVFFSRR